MNNNSQRETIVVGQLSDAFPPIIDGVSSVVENYARMGHAHQGGCFVVTNRHPSSLDKEKPYPVLRIPAIGAGKTFEYRIGLPFGRKIVRNVAALQPDLLHVHSPFAASILGRRLKKHMPVPVVMTYHTKYSIDVIKYLKFRWLSNIACRLIVEQFESADEVWAVSQGAADDLASMGFQGECFIMENGCDLPDGPVGAEHAEQVRQLLGDRPGPVLLFVGRMMWYKNIGLILNALSVLHEQQLPFQMVFVGAGVDAAQIKKRTTELGLDECVHFAGRISDRQLLRAFYSAADLFVFPSAFDTAGIVVQEAAACACPSLLLEGSCAAEHVEDGVNGFLTEETALSVAYNIRRVLADSQALKRVGLEAQRTLYHSWEETADMAWARYQALCRLHEGSSTRRKTRKKKVLKDIWG